MLVFSLSFVDMSLRLVIVHAVGDIAAWLRQFNCLHLK